MSHGANKNICIDTALIVAALAGVIFGLLSLYNGWAILSWISIIATDIYLFAAIFSCSDRADKKNNTYQGEWSAPWLFPSRRIGVITIPLMSIALIVSFAGLYWSINTALNFKNVLSSYTDALYYSLVTLTTVGYGDIVPLSGPAKKLVML